MGKTIGIVSLKGGVGKTSVVASLGGAMSSFGKKVLLVDGNFSAPNLGLHLDVIKPEKTLHHALNNVFDIKETICDLGSFHLIPSSLSNRSEVNYFKLKDKIKSLKRRYDAILLDSSPALNDETLSVMLASDYILVVTTPDYPTLSNTLKAIKLAKQRGTNIAGLILNKVYDKNFELSLDDIESAIEVPVLAVIPHEVNVLRALSEGTPYTIYKPKSKGSREFKRLAATLMGEKNEPVKLRKFWKWAVPSKQDINRDLFYDRVLK